MSGLLGFRFGFGFGFGFMLVETSIETNNFSPDRNPRNLILGFAPAPKMQSMYLDFDEIEKLTPRGLLNLRPMEFVVEVIAKLIAAQIAGSAVMLKLVRALGRYQKQVREDEAYNLNVKIKAWVLAKAARRAWVRGIIGEAAIRRWRARYDSLAHPVECEPVRRTVPRAAPMQECLPYTWRRFVMADLSWLETKPLTPLNTSTRTTVGKWQHPRQARGFKPVEFYDFELAADYQPRENNLTQADKKNTRMKAASANVPEPPPKKNTAKQNKDPASTSDKPP